jgi:hypothetical protein
MRHHGLIMTLWAFGILTPFVQAQGQASDSKLSEPSLKGLTALRPVVEQLGPKVEGKGLTREQLQTDLELRLRKAGVTVSSGAQALLYANIAIVCNELECAYNIDLEVQQAVRLSVSPESPAMLATTWKTGTTGLLSGRKLQSIRDLLGAQIDKFLNAYLTAKRK